MARNADVNQRFADSEKLQTRKMANPASNSPHVKRPSVAVWPMAPFSPGRDLNRLDFTARFRSGGAKAQSASMISIIRRGAAGKRDDDAAGFESPEPTSPKVSCIGQIKLNQKWAKNAKVEYPKLGKLKKLFFGCNKEEEEREEEPTPNGAVCPAEEPDGAPCPSPGHLKRYTSGSRDAKFGEFFAGGEPIAARGGSILLEVLPRPQNKGGPSEINIWKRRAVAAPKGLEVKGACVGGGLGIERPYTM